MTFSLSADKLVDSTIYLLIIMKKNSFVDNIKEIGGNIKEFGEKLIQIPLKHSQSEQIHQSEWIYVQNHKVLELPRQSLKIVDILQ
jgi:hypothetical protein